MGVLAAAELAACSPSCCIRTPVSACFSPVPAGHGALTTLRGHPLLGPRTLGCGYKSRRVIMCGQTEVNLVHAVAAGTPLYNLARGG
eukprot:4289205-Prymnesium_polylepis.1